MEIYYSTFIILGAILLGAMSPGPSFVLVAKIAVSTSKQDGIWASIGMGVGGVIFCFLALQGTTLLLVNAPTLYMMFKIIGGLYLVYIGISIWKGSKENIIIDNSNLQNNSSLRKSFIVGLLTQISNPKTALVYSSIFTALLPSNVNNNIYFILPPLIFIVETGWYLIVTLVLSSNRSRNTYLKSKSIIDKAAALIMGTLGSKLIFSINES